MSAETGLPRDTGCASIKRQTCVGYNLSDWSQHFGSTVLSARRVAPCAGEPGAGAMGAPHDAGGGAGPRAPFSDVLTDFMGLVGRAEAPGARLVARHLELDAGNIDHLLAYAGLDNMRAQ